MYGRLSARSPRLVLAAGTSSTSYSCSKHSKPVIVGSSRDSRAVVGASALSALEFSQSVSPGAMRPQAFFFFWLYIYIYMQN